MTKQRIPRKMMGMLFGEKERQIVQTVAVEMFEGNMSQACRYIVRWFGVNSILIPNDLALGEEELDEI